MKSSDILSPACGRVIDIASTETDPGLKGLFTCISVFLAVWDDHTTRSPITGRIESICYTPGKFGIALFKKNLLKNENNLVLISGEGVRLAVRQIAGRMARRIVFDCKESEKIQQGQKIGAILLGSCVQTYLPVDAKVIVRVGQKVIAGKTVVARSVSK